MDSALLAVLNADTTEFPTLIRLASLDPSKDLAGCNFSGIDFGALEVDCLNLDDCNLEGADLSKVLARTISIQRALTTNLKWPSNSVENVIPAMMGIRQSRLDVLKSLTRFVHRFDGVLEYRDILTLDLSSLRPIIFPFDSVVEQDLLETRLTEELIDFEIPLSPRRSADLSKDEVIPPNRFQRLTSKHYPFDTKISSTEALDQSFLASFENAVKPHLDPPPNLGKITERNVTVYLQIAFDVRSVPRMLRLVQPRLLLLSGFPPLSTRMLDVIREAVAGISIVITTPRRFIEANAIRRKPFAKAYVVERTQKMTYVEQDALTAYFLRMRSKGVVLTSASRNFLDDSVQMPISRVKNYFLTRIQEQAGKLRGPIEL